MSRSGIMPMIGTICQMLQLPKYDFRVVGRERGGDCNSDGATHVLNAAPISNRSQFDLEGMVEEMLEGHGVVENSLSYSNLEVDADYHILLNRSPVSSCLWSCA